MAIEIQNLIVEVTRRCNFSCSHCLRGNQENLDIELESIEAIFKEVSQIGTITFTGGEPQIAVAPIRMILNLAKIHHVEIGNFYVTTNGAINSKSFALLMMEWYMFCHDNEVTKIEISKDYYHEIEGYVNIDELYIGALRFTDYRDEGKDGDESLYIAQGRFAYSRGSYLNVKDDLAVTTDGLNCEIEELYLNAKGDLIADCDLSYENQEHHKIGTTKNGFQLKMDEELYPVQEWCKRQIEKAAIV